MFCPTCGFEERQLSQYCRGCGMDLRVVRTGIERSGPIPDAAASARAEIGYAIADRIKELKTGRELHRLTEWVLPKVERFLESPEEKRLRRMRAGVITSSIGLSVIAMFMILALASGKEEFLLPAAAGVLAFIIGLGILINGKMLSTPREKSIERLDEQEGLDLSAQVAAIGSRQRKKELAASRAQPHSVIEHTTHRLSTDPIVVRDRTNTVDK